MGRVLVDPWEREEEEEEEAESPCCVPGIPLTSSRSPAASPLGPGAGGTTSSSQKTAPGMSPGAPRPPGISQPFSQIPLQSSGFPPGGDPAKSEAAVLRRISPAFPSAACTSQPAPAAPGISWRGHSVLSPEAPGISGSARPSSGWQPGPSPFPAGAPEPPGIPKPSAGSPGNPPAAAAAPPPCGSSACPSSQIAVLSYSLPALLPLIQVGHPKDITPGMPQEPL